MKLVTLKYQNDVKLNNDVDDGDSADDDIVIESCKTIWSFAGPVTINIPIFILTDYLPGWKTEDEEDGSQHSIMPVTVDTG